jgi:murein DD-endopeptidase MepM/ murein hydrolase activator NlpD
VRAGRAVFLLLLFAASPALAEVTFEGQFVQGGLVQARTTPDATVTLDGRKLRLTPDGAFLIGFGRDAGATATLVLSYPDGGQETKTLTVAPRQWDIQRIEGLPERQVTPSAADLARIRDDQAQVTAARARDTAETLFRTGFVWPAMGPISGVYGSQRILNGQPRQPHYGLDIAAPVGTPVVAPADGIVSLVHEDMFFTGKTLALDHGYGLNSVYSHLSEIAVKPGERVTQGQMIGRVGATGRVTGAHLDWRVNLFDIRLDPALLVPAMPAANPASAGAATAIGPGASESTAPSAR